MTRYKKLLLNSTTSVLYQVVSLACGFVLPKLILSRYGSSVNGLISSITQFLGVIALCEMGVGSVVQSSLYKPLANKDTDQVSRIAVSSEKFFRRIALLLVVYTVALMGVYPIVTLDEFDYLYTLLLIFVISISNFAQYYFGMTYGLILSADQYGFVNFSLRSFTLILNTALCAIFIKCGASIHMVKLTTSVLFLLRPLVVAIIAKRKYKINRKIAIAEEPIQQKWNGLAQHIASVVHKSAPAVVLTLCSTLENVSVYAVYNLVVSGIKSFVVSLTDGMHSMIGNMLAKNETKELDNTFEGFEWFMHTVVTIVFSLMGALIVPFVMVYTKGLTDVNYKVPAFALIFVIGEAIYCLRLPYNILVLSAGHYKQTQTSSFIEAIISVVVSVVLVFWLGLLGVAIGSLCAMLYRTLYLVWYLSRNIVHRKITMFAKHMIVDIICGAALAITIYLIPDFFKLQSISYFSWVVLAIKIGVVCVLESALINFVFYRKALESNVAKMVNKFVKKKSR